MRVATRASLQNLCVSADLFGFGQDTPVPGIELVGGKILDVNWVGILIGALIGGGIIYFATRK